MENEKYCFDCINCRPMLGDEWWCDIEHKTIFDDKAIEPKCKKFEEPK